MRRVSYHQSVFDLLDLRPRISAEARASIEACEARSGRRLPAAVRDWYSTENVVLADELPPEAEETPDEPWDDSLWYDYSNMDHPEPLTAVLEQFTQRSRGEPSPEGPDLIRVMGENQGCCSWYIRLDGSENPPVVVDHDFEGREWFQVADRFSGFVFDWFAGYYFMNWTPLSERTFLSSRRTRPPREKVHLDGLWLSAPADEPLAPPYLDFLIENFAEESRQQIADGVIQYQFRDEDGLVRVTSDGYGEPDGVSAWWLHAPSAPQLLRLARRIRWCGTLSTTLRHATEPGGLVLDRLRAEQRS
jgi:hypothetical protein